MFPMTHWILERWMYRCEATTDRYIVPDGCRDLLYWIEPGRPPRWSLSHLQEGVMPVRIPEGTTIVGYRLVPGTELAGRVLTRLTHNSSEDPDHAIAGVLEDVRCDRRVAEALSAIATVSVRVDEAADLLGTSRRTLERVLVRHTGKPPVFWSQLARVRMAARALLSGANAVETAYEAGFSDQAHLSRSIRRWLGVTPTQLVRRPDLAEQLDVPGYDAATVAAEGARESHAAGSCRNSTVLLTRREIAERSTTTVAGQPSNARRP